MMVSADVLVMFHCSFRLNNMLGITFKRQLNIDVMSHTVHYCMCSALSYLICWFIIDIKSKQIYCFSHHCIHLNAHLMIQINLNVKFTSSYNTLFISLFYLFVSHCLSYSSHCISHLVQPFSFFIFPFPILSSMCLCQHWKAEVGGVCDHTFAEWLAWVTHAP